MNFVAGTGLRWLTRLMLTRRVFRAHSRRKVPALLLCGKQRCAYHDRERHIMGRSSNIPQGHSENVRFERVATTPIPPRERIATRASFFSGYEAGHATRYIGCIYEDSDGYTTLWAKAFNGRNEGTFAAILADMKANAEYREVNIPELAIRRDWLTA